MRGTALVAAAAALALLTGCGAPGAAGTAQTPTPPSSPTEAAPEPSEEELRHERALEIVDSMTTRERVASIVMGTTPGVDAEALGAYIADNGLGGFILMGDNIPSNAEELRSITDALTVDPELPPLIAVDQEGGIVSRLPWDTNPGADALKFAEPADTTTAFRARAELLREAGISINFGIVADVPSTEESFIYGRALGPDPTSASERVAAAVAGEQGIVLSTLKHFPGHGAAEGDSHLGVPSTDMDRDTWGASHALPFAAGIDAGAGLLMFGHLAYTSVDPIPASLSPEWHRIAREELGFDGLIVSDDLGMLLDSGVPEYEDLASVVVRALAAGTDLALVIRGAGAQELPGLIDAVAAAAESGTLSEERLEDAAVRVAEARLALGTG